MGSYTLNELICNYFNRANNQPTIRITQILQSSRKILAVDEESTYTDDSIWAPQNGPDLHNSISIRHDRTESLKTAALLTTGRGNVVFVDAHAEFFPRADSFLPYYYDPKTP